MNDEVMREFLLETQENLAQLDTDLLTLEKEPTEKQTLARVFRTLHSVKGTAGFLGLVKLQAVAHSAESLLSKLRAGESIFNQPIATALLQVVDAIRQVIASIESNGTEGTADYTALVDRLEELRTNATSPAPAPPPAVPVAPAAPTPPLATPTSQTVVTRPALTEDPLQDSPTDSRATAVADTTLRVDVGLLDKLMTLVGELVLARNQIVQFSTSQEEAGFLGTVQRLNLLTTELQTSVMKTRMQPISNVWSKFPRIVRDLSVTCGKQIRFDMEGQETELDKTIIEAIRDPLTHMVRNAVDHGIELPNTRTSKGKPAEGRLHLQASHEGGKVIIEIRDDGGGIDPQRVRDKAIQNKLITPDDAAKMSERELTHLIFLPGFSTAEKVTQLSGRGVGMDVVRTNIERIGGTVDLESRLGEGTTVRMKIPLTLAIIPALTITSAGERFCIPQVNLLELVRLDAEHAHRGIEFIQGAPVYRLRGNLLPIVYLDRELGLLPNGLRSTDEVMIVVLQADDRAFGLVVDAIHDTQEIVVKPLQQQLKGLTVYSGATILGDGRVALILDVLGVAQRANVLTNKQQRSRSLSTTSESRIGLQNRAAVLLFATPNGGRMAIPLDQVARLEEFPRSVIEKLGPHNVVQYRGEILRLISVAELFGDGGSDLDSASSVQVVVHVRNGKSVGLAIGRILDVVDEELQHTSSAARPGVKFNAVLQGKVAEFLDLDEVFRRAQQVMPNTPEAYP